VRVYIEKLIQNAIGGDILTENDGGFIAVMSKKGVNVQNDIPVAFEMYSLLSFFMSSLPITDVELSDDMPEIALTPSILYDSATQRLVVLVPIGRQALSDVAYWISDNFRSDHVKQMPGILAIPFSIEMHDTVYHLLPEWFCAFYVDGDKNHCVPLLSFKSVMDNAQFGGDWVDVALKRMAAFCLPHEEALRAAKTTLTSSQD